MQVLLTLSWFDFSYIQEKLFERCPEQIGASSKEAVAVDGVSSQKSAAHTDVPPKILPKLEAEISNDGQVPTDKSLKCSGQGEQDEKSSEFDVREPPLQSVSGDESDESDIIEHDVSSCVIFILWRNLPRDVFFFLVISGYFLCIFLVKCIFVILFLHFVCFGL